MKSAKRIKPAVKIACPQRGCSFVTLPHASDASRKDDGANHHNDSFEIVEKMLLGMSSFSLRDSFALARSYGGFDDCVEVQKLFEKFVKRTLAEGRIVAQKGCYDFQIYFVL